MFKEMILPNDADRFLFRLAPLLSMIPALAAWAVIPFRRRLEFCRYQCWITVSTSDDIVRRVRRYRCGLGF